MKQLIIALSLFISSTAFAFDKTPFTAERFEQLQQQNVPVLIDVYATWCGTCAKQQRILESYFDEHENSSIQVLVVDYDEQKDWVKHFRAPRQSTLLIYQGTEQQWFSVAETRKHKIFAALQDAEVSK